MRTVLILSDFSYAAFNAARYGVMLPGNTDNGRIILCHSIVPSLVASNGVLSGPVNVSLKKLEDLKISLEPFKNPKTTIECRVEQQELTNAIATIIKDEAVDLIVAGNKGKSVGQFVLGSNLIDLIRGVHCPLLVVPSETFYEPIQTVIFACDLNDVEKIPVSVIRGFTQSLHCKLHILNVDHRSREKVYIKNLIQENKLDVLFGKEDPNYHNIHYNGVVEGIRHFCNLYKAALLIVVHKKHGLLHNIIHGSITKKLSVDTSIPVLIVRETD